MKIGDISIKSNIFLAPMAGITDLPFRVLCKEHGCGFAYTEMVSAKGLYYNDAKSYKLTEIDDREEQAVAIQIFGSDPDIMASVAYKLNSSKASIIDINMGCPTPKVTKNGDGCALMKNPKLIGEIINSVYKVTSKPVTIKIRKGWDDNNINAVEVAKIAQQNGAKAITVHGRTREQFYSGKVDLNIIKEVKNAVSIPVIGNGDVFSAEDADEMFQKTKCDAIMIGRSSLGNPWVFSSIINKGNVTDRVSKWEKLNVILQHINMMVNYKGEQIAVREMRKHIAWYIKGMRNANIVKEKVFKITYKQELIELLNKFFMEE